MKLLQHGMKVGEMVSENMLPRIVYFGFMPERGTVDAVFISRRMQEVYHAIG